MLTSQVWVCGEDVALGGWQYDKAVRLTKLRFNRTLPPERERESERERERTQERERERERETEREREPVAVEEEGGCVVGEEVEVWTGVVRLGAGKTTRYKYRLTKPLNLYIQVPTN